MPTALRHLLLDIVFMETVGMRLVVVHGGGAAINRAMDAAGIEPRFIQGRRYTDDATLEIVEQVLAYETNECIAARIEEFGGRAMPLNFRTTQRAVRRADRSSTDDDGKPIDLGHVGRVTRVDRTTIENLCYAGTVPVIPSMCLGAERREAQRERRHGGDGGRPGARRREAGIPERRERRAARKKMIPTRSFTRLRPRRPAS